MKIKRIIIIILSLLVAVLISVSFFYIKNSNTQNKIKKEIQNIVDNINTINSLFEKQPMADSIDFGNSSNYVCKKYSEDKVYYEKLEKVYIEPYIYNGYYVLLEESFENEDSAELYMCKNVECDVKKISIEDIEILNYSDDEINVSVNGEENKLIKDNDLWKFEKQILLCK